MKVPTQLVELGLALELGCDTYEWRWNLSDKMKLFSNPKGNKLVLLYFPKAKKVKHPKNIKKQDFTKAKGLYERFQGFKWDQIAPYLIEDRNLELIGKGEYICYRSDKWGTKKIDYKHAFSCSPSIWVDNALPHVIVISSPKLRVTQRGIKG